MKSLIFIFLQILLSLESVSDETLPDDILMNPIASTGPPDLSIGWEMISLRTELGDTIKIDSTNENGEIVEVSISGKNNIKLDLSLFENIRNPDLRTLNDIWYHYKLDKINYITFEFNKYFDGTSFIKGRFKAYVELENEEVDVFVKIYDPVTKAWNSPLSK